MVAQAPLKSPTAATRGQRRPCCSRHGSRSAPGLLPGGTILGRGRAAGRPRLSVSAVSGAHGQASGGRPVNGCSLPHDGRAQQWCQTPNASPSQEHCLHLCRKKRARAASNPQPLTPQLAFRGSCDALGHTPGAGLSHSEGTVLRGKDLSAPECFSREPP